jgi:hypothetical protein
VEDQDLSAPGHVQPVQLSQRFSDAEANASPGAPLPTPSRVVGGSSNIHHNSTHRNEENASPAAPNVPAAVVATSETAGATRTKSVGAIEKEVQELLDEKVFGRDDAAKVEALRKLKKYLLEGGSSGQESQQQKEYGQAVSNLGGCHLVLIALRQELDKDGGPNRNVVLKVVQFLQNWTFLPCRRDTMSRFRGVGMVARAIDACSTNEAIQLAAIACLFNYASDGDATRCQKLLDGNCLRGIVRAASPSTKRKRTQVLAMRLLGRLCEVGGRSHVDRMIECGALVAAARTYSEHKGGCNHPECELRVVARRLMNKLHG